jgi:hypothetical protein
MRKAIWLLVVFVLAVTVAHAQLAIWNLSRDVRATNNQISFNEGSKGVWYFMESASLKHIPTIYSFLPNYFAPCSSGPNTPLVIGSACWEDATHTIDLNPKVGVNFTNQTQFLVANDAIPPHAFFLHPAPDRFAIVAWKSPLNAIVSISGSFTDLDPNCGNGVLWFVEKGTQRLAFGDLPNGGAQTFSVPSVIVSPGQILYFIVDPKNRDYFCDTTMLDLSIDEVI